MRYGSAFCLLLMTGCSNMPAASSLPAGSPSQQVRTGSAGFQTIYTFKGVPDGAVPVGALLTLNGVLYGTTNYGGDNGKDCSPGEGCGTIYQVESGQESVIYRFQVQANGLRPYAGLTDVNGTLYGTTQEGGTHNDGTVFAFSTSGSLKVLFSFDGSDGGFPRAQLTNVNGVLYGTTYLGGATGVGTVFSITTGGTEKVLYSFQGGADGAEPLGALIGVNGKLYGTTLSGGTHNDGTVFAIGTKGNEEVLHSFAGGRSDGSEPFAGLTDLDGALYGTTNQAGAHGDGTVFKITTSGTENTIYSFQGGTDGANPFAGLTLLTGQLYGVASHGGSNNNGTIYTVTASGAEKVLYNFGGTSDGRHPYANLTVNGSALYGTTNSGGTYEKGTVFEFTP